MSQLVKSQSDLIAVITSDEHGDNLVLIKSDNGTIDQLLKDKPLGASITFEEVKHPAYGKLVMPTIRRGFNQCNTEITRKFFSDLPETYT